MTISFEDIIGTIMIFSTIYIYTKSKELSMGGAIIILFGTILIGLSDFKDIKVSIGMQGINATFNTLTKEIKKINNYAKQLSLKQLKQRISIIEIHNSEFNEEKTREDLDNMLDKSNITENYKWKKKCEKLVRYNESYPLIIKNYNEKQAPQIIETCIKAKELNKNDLEYSFLLAIAYHRNQDYEITIQILKELANKNYPIAQRKLGIMYLFGNLVNQDIIKAKKWLMKSAENGDKASQEIFNENLIDGKSYLDKILNSQVKISPYFSTQTLCVQNKLGRII